MSTTPDPFSSWLNALAPPAWMVAEAQGRLVLLLNHVLQQEPEAMVRLERQHGQVARLVWQRWSLALTATPVGLLDLAPADARPDLTLTVMSTSPFDVLALALRGDKPPVHIEGNVQLAAEVNWLIDHVRWDMQADLARLVGDVPAHQISQVAGGAAAALRSLVQRMPSASPMSDRPGGEGRP
jgi:ubiquinone biosynthesis accessory factor UbiJ